MWWAFWRRRPAEPRRALPADYGLPQSTRPPPAAAPPDDDDARPSSGPVARTSGASPTADVHPAYATPLTAAPPDVDREAVAAAGADVTALLAGAPVSTDDRTLAVASTGALAARLPALSGTDDAAALGEIEDDLLHAYAELLASRATTRPGADRDDLLAVAHLAAAAASEDAANDPALLLLADVPAARQVAAAVVLLAQTADDGGGAPDRLAAEVRGLFRPAG